MKLQVQWTLAAPQPYEWIDSSEWAGLPFKAEPIGGEIIDEIKGWPYAIACQGIPMYADHYAVEDGIDSIVIYTWNDDPEDYPVGEKFGAIWEFFPIGVSNTNQKLERFGEENYLAKLVQASEWTCAGEIGTRREVERKAWNFYRYPAEALIRHGIWVPDPTIYDVFEPASWLAWIE